jgi:hypothetical protein
MAVEKKEIFNFKIEPSVIKEAKRKVQKERMTLAEKLRRFLTSYVSKNN